MNSEGIPQQVKCPQNQQVEVRAGRKSGRFTARFDAETCEGCPLLEQCPTKALQRNRGHVIRFKQQQVNVARRRRNQRKAQASGLNLRSAVEATVRSLKHPFGNGKLPVRGQPRVSMMMVASAAMTNARRIWRYQVLKKAGENSQMAVENGFKRVANFVVCIFLRPFFRFFAGQADHSPAVA